MSSKYLLEIIKHDFSDKIYEKIESNHYVKELWPLVYILTNDSTKQAYVGETANPLMRLKTHLKHEQKKTLKTARLILCDKFNKSATLDIESNLIKYLSGDGKFILQNGNLGLANHSYYQKEDIYWDIFKALWSELKTQGLVNSSIQTINNSDLFKYSPYKTLTTDQKAGLIQVMKALLDETKRTILIEGGAGTGKTILATYLFTILHTKLDELDLSEFNDEGYEFSRLVKELKEKYYSPKAFLVIPMASFRETISRIFKNIKGLRRGMVIGPAEVSDSKSDILIIDESHRLRRRINLGAYYGAFDKVNKKLGFDKYTGNELDWVLKMSEKQIFFYDSDQSIKPSDIESNEFEALKKNSQTVNIRLKSQLRSKGGNDYVSYVDRLLHNKFEANEGLFNSSEYEFALYESLGDMISEIKRKNSVVGLSRIIAGFSWPWISNKKGQENEFDIVIGDTKLRWNTTNKDWVNSLEAIDEVGCIHTTQGYDLNYSGVIFGNEIGFNETTQQITISPENYFDKNGKQNIKSPTELKEFIINIYKTLMLRSIKGTYVYVCDPALRKYFKKHIQTHSIISNQSNAESVIIENEIKSPYIEGVTSVPLYESIGCGEAMYAQSTTAEQMDVPSWLIKPGAKYFAIRTRGDSMNKLGVEDGDIILCQKNYQAPNGSNAVVLIGENATLKQIKFEKDGLVLIPKSTNAKHRIRKITEADEDFKVLGVFVCKLKDTEL